jgi:hypothetical protein
MPALIARKPAMVAALLLVPVISVWWMLRPHRTVGPCVISNGPETLPELPESSGLAVSRRNPGLLWSINDSGAVSAVFALDEAGAQQGRVRIPVRMYDWEDISAAPCGSGDCLYIADIGDNSFSRDAIQIVRLPEPAPSESESEMPDVLNARYGDTPHNAEAMFVIGADLFIVTRDRVGGVYRAMLESDSANDLVFERVGQLELEVVTDAETSRDGTSVVVRTSHEAVLYRASDLLSNHFVPYVRVPIDGLKEPQGEGVALDGSMLYLSSEGKPWRRAGRFLSLHCDWPD